MTKETAALFTEGKERLDKATDGHMERHAVIVSLTGAIAVVQNYCGSEDARPLIVLLGALEDLDKGRRPTIFDPLSKPHRPPPAREDNARRATATAIVDYYVDAQRRKLNVVLKYVARGLNLSPGGLASFRKKLHSARGKNSKEKRWLDAIEYYDGIMAALTDNTPTIEEVLNILGQLLTHPAQKGS